MDLQFGEFRLKRRERLVSGPNGTVDLSARAFDILCYLLGHHGEVVEKNALLEAVWPGVVVEDNTLQVHMSALRKALGPEMIATVHGRGYRYAGPPPDTDTARTSVADSPARKPVIVILPFDNLGGDPAQQYFSDGITADITDRLSRFHSLAVIGHHSASVFRGGASEFTAIRERLKANFVATGSTRRSPERIRIAVRLSDAASETVLWAEHYDRPSADLFDLQDEVANLIAAAISRHLAIEVTSRSGGKNAANLSSYENLLLGLWQFRKLTRPANDDAIASFSRAVELDPRNIDALAWLALGHINRWCTDFSSEDVKTGVALAIQAIERDPTNARSHLTLGFGQLWFQGLDAARKTMDRAVTLNPVDSDVLANRALISAYLGEFNDGRQWLDRAYAIEPIPPPWFGEFRGIIDIADGHYAKALPGVEFATDSAWEMMYALACYGHLGLQEEARTCIARFRQEGRAPAFLAAVAREPYADPAIRERLAEDIAKALAF